MEVDEVKKVERKRKRFAIRLKNSKGVQCVDIPSPNIVLCNVGQATGMEKCIIHKLIKDNAIHMPLPKFIAEKGETHSFLVFSSTENAIVFYNTFNGKRKVRECDSPLYMNFVEQVPSTEITYPDEVPKGLTLLNDFITSEEEKKYIKLFDWPPDIICNSLKNRQVKHYGYEFRYGSNDVDLNNPLAEKIPEECNVLWEWLKEQGHNLEPPDQLTVNKYSPGQGIPSHVDKHSPFGSTILSLSLGSDVVMDWKHHTGKYVPVLVKARSLLIMQDEARYDWQHGIQSRTWDPVIEQRTISNGIPRSVRVITNETIPRNTRISLTFRWTRRGPCTCSYETLCDSSTKVSPEDLEHELASNLEELHVHQVYEQIASHFSSTRHAAWPHVVRFVQRAAAASVLLDLGCGNGKNILPRDDIVQIAGERSSGLLAECKNRINGVSAADCVRLDLLDAGLRDGCADVVICIAVIHHFSSRARRLRAVETIHRLLRADGRALITVWAKDQTESRYLCERREAERRDDAEIAECADDAEQTTRTVGGVLLPVHRNRTQFRHRDLLVPWRRANDPDSALLRYYHVFEQGELDQLCLDAGFTVERAFYDQGNWCVECVKQ